MKKKVIGVIGGLGPLVTAHFMELVIEMTDARRDQENVDMIVYNFPSIPDRTGYILGSNLKSPLPGLKNVGHALARQKVSCIAIPCVTAHYFHKELQEVIPVPIINGVTETANLLKSHGIKKVGIMATDGTIRSGLLSRELDFAGIVPVVPSSKRQEDVMHLIYEKHPKTITAFLGAIYAGCYYVPLDADMPLYRIELILKNLNPAACICDDTTFSVAKELNNIGQIYSYDEIATGEVDDSALQAVRNRQIDTDPIYIVFTSGSTGIPKGVVGCHRAVIDYIENLCEVLKFDEDTVFGNQTPLYFDACLKEIIPTLKYGATTHLIPRKLFLLPVKLVEYLNEKKINTLCWVVSALTYISAFRTFETVTPQYLKTIAFASEVFPIRQMNIWRQALPNTRFINLYGPTETTGICCYFEVDREFTEDEVLPVGRPFPNTEVILLNENDHISAPGEQGEICIRGTRLTHGYFAPAGKYRCRSYFSGCQYFAWKDNLPAPWRRPSGGYGGDGRCHGKPHTIGGRIAESCELPQWW